MDPGIEQALISLIPSISGRPPTELVQLATSLLAQSRTRASSLKADEEIARNYACANLACERLKHSLMLPKIDPKPPIPPRVYRKLYQYLDSQLPANNPRKRTRTSQAKENNNPPVIALKKAPKRKAATARRSSNIKQQAPVTPKLVSHVQVPAKTSAQVQVQVPAKSPTHIEVQVPAKTPSLIQAQTPTPAPTFPLSSVPEWVNPAVLVLCANIFHNASIDVVHQGIRAVLTEPAPYLPNNPNAPEQAQNKKLPAVVISICCFVETRMTKTKNDNKNYYGRRDRAVQIMNNDFKHRYENWEQISEQDVDDWMLEIGARGYLRLDWIEKVKIGCLSEVPQKAAVVVDGAEGESEYEEGGEYEEEGGDGEYVYEEEEEEEEEEEDGHKAKKQRLTSGAEEKEDRKASMQPGLGTMLQDKTDFLSDEKREAFEQFKARIVAWAEDIASYRRRRSRDRPRRYS